MYFAKVILCAAAAAALLHCTNGVDWKLFMNSSEYVNRNESIHVVGIDSKYFAYFDVKNCRFKGIDISLVTIIAEKLNATIILDRADLLQTKNVIAISPLHFLETR